MGLLTRILILSVVASVTCLGAPLEKQQAVENFQKAAKNLENALNDIVQHSATEVRAASLLKEADETRQVYTEQFIPALDDLTPFLLSDKDVKSLNYEAEVVQELREALQNISLSQDELLSLVLGDDVMQADGARLEVSLRLLTALVQRLVSSSELQEVSLATVREVSVVGGAAMEAVVGVRNAVEDAEEDAKTAFANTLNDMSSSQEGSTAPEEAEGVTVKEDDDVKSDGSLKRVRNKRQFRTSIRLGRGWSLGLGGLSFKRKNFNFNVKPTFRGFRPSGVRFRLSWKFG